MIYSSCSCRCKSSKCTWRWVVKRNLGGIGRVTWNTFIPNSHFFSFSLPLSLSLSFSFSLPLFLSFSSSFPSHPSLPPFPPLSLFCPLRKLCLCYSLNRPVCKLAVTPRDFCRLVSFVGDLHYSNLMTTSTCCK